MTVGPVLVTGGTGFIGGHVCQSFLDRGEEVVALSRSDDVSPSNGIRMARVSDLLDRNALRSALDGIQTVIHLAGRVHAKREGRDDPESECRRVNVDGTRALLDEAVTAGVRRFIFISSVKAVANESDVALDENTPPMPTDAYGASKLEAERLVRVVSARENLHAPILRLPVVYGPGMKSNMLRLFQAVSRGIPLPIAGIHNRRSFAYVDNVTEAIHSILSAPGAAHETFFVSDGADFSTPELTRKIATALSRQSRMFAVPVPVLRALGGAGYLLSRISPFHFTLDSLSALVGSLFVDTSKIQKMTGYKRAVSVDEGLAQTAIWLSARSISRMQ
ncbi:MAG: NAD-dependent epimerase/dehydratase family protein [Gemmatimonadaceae bacterium]